MRIGLFDSGLGGLTVLKELLNKHPNNEYIYYGDTLNIPYGTKEKEELLVLATKIVKFLEEKKVDLIIIACGTVSSNIYEELRSICKVPLMNIIDPTINYIINKNYHKIGLMATPRTIESKTFNKKLQTEITAQSCPLLVPFIENNKINTIECKEAVKEYLENINNNNVEALVLGCTHYPIIEDIIKNNLNKNIDIINMGTILANNLKLIASKESLELYFSKVEYNLREIVSNILDRDIRINNKPL